MYQCRLIKSRRRTISLQIEKDGTIIIRAPRGVSKSHIDKFLDEKKKWITKKVTEVKSRKQKAEIFSKELKNINEYKEKARQHLENRADYFSKEYNLPYNKIRLSSAKTRWGSCGHSNNLNFNWKIIFAPSEVIDYLVVHELAHTKHKNHQKNFWSLVAKMDPEFKKNRKRLKQNSFLLDVN